MTIRDKVDEVVDMAMQIVNRYGCAQADADALVDGIREIGWQWQECNAHGHALTISAAMLAGEELDMDNLPEMERKGTEAVFEAVTMPVYTAIYMAHMPKPEGWEEYDADHA